EVVQPTDDRGVELDDDDDDDDTGMPPLEDTKPLASLQNEVPSWVCYVLLAQFHPPVPPITCVAVATAGNGLLKKKVLREGQGDESRPRRRQEVTMRVKSMLGDGTVVDEQEALRFTVGDGDVIQALDLCAELMALGEVAEITTDAKYAYGALGR
uniref:peptidylprolyl isomerase n=1 Tax=Petromyzon marinus TaxID=7757 RepID=S4RF36_PETMA